MLSQENVQRTHRTVWQIVRETGIQKSSLLNIRTVQIDTDTDSVRNSTFLDVFL